MLKINEEERPFSVEQVHAALAGLRSAESTQVRKVGPRPAPQDSDLDAKAGTSINPRRRHWATVSVIVALVAAGLAYGLYSIIDSNRTLQIQQREQVRLAEVDRLERQRLAELSDRLNRAGNHVEALEQFISSCDDSCPAEVLTQAQHRLDQGPTRPAALKARM